MGELPIALFVGKSWMPRSMSFATFMHVPTGVAERYEVVCNFQSLAGRTLYLLNVKDDERMKNVPFFCFSHLIAKVVVAACPATSVVPGKGEAPQTHARNQTARLA